MTLATILVVVLCAACAFCGYREGRTRSADDDTLAALERGLIVAALGDAERNAQASEARAVAAEERVAMLLQRVAAECEAVAVRAPGGEQ